MRLNQRFRRTSDGLLVALKYIHRHMAGDGEMRRRFLREALALGALDHPNIVRPLDRGRMARGRSGCRFW